jgi:hypothetical protein
MTLAATVGQAAVGISLAAYPAPALPPFGVAFLKLQHHERP